MSEFHFLRITAETKPGSVEHFGFQVSRKFAAHEAELIAEKGFWRGSRFIPGHKIHQVEACVDDDQLYNLNVPCRVGGADDTAPPEFETFVEMIDTSESRCVNRSVLRGEKRNCND